MARSRSISRKLRSFLAVGPRRQLLVIEAIMHLAVSRITLLVMPFERLSPGFGAFVAPDDPRVTARVPLDAAAARLIKDIGWSVRASAPFMPFRSLCLQQAMAAHAMLRRRGIVSVIHVGAGRNEAGPPGAHAWLDASGIGITGYPVPADITEIGCFVRA